MLACSLYAYVKITDSKLKPIHLLYIPAFAVCSAGLHFVWVYFRLAVPVALLFICVLAFFIGFRRRFYSTLSLSTMALGMTVFFMAVSTAIASLAMLLLDRFIPENFKDLFIVSIFSVLMILLTLLIFKIKKIKKRIVPITNDDVYEKLLFISVLSIFGMTLTFTTDREATFLEIGFIFISFCCLSIILGWRKMTANSYRKNILDRNVEVLEYSAREYNAERERLAEQNSELAKIIHRDNKLLPAMELSVRSLLERYPDDKQAKELLQGLNKLFAERANAVESFRSEATILQTSGDVTIDSVLGFLNAKAADYKVEFTAEAEEGAVEFFREQFKELTDFNAILCDLGENALIAAKHVKNGKVKAVLDYAGGIATLKLYDNGALFDEKVIAEMGRTEITTHKNDGGSGIGLVTAFKILKKYSASICIDEVLADDACKADGYAKCIVIRADGNGLRVIKTGRDSVKKIAASRSDLTVE